MNRYNRRDFLKANALAALSIPFGFFKQVNPRPLLSFATLGCPDWSLARMLNYAVEFGYDGIEFRGLQREFDLTKCTEFSTRDNILSTAKRFADRNIKITDLGSSAVMHAADPALRKINIDLAKRFVGLAQQLDCPFVRVFPDKFEQGLGKSRSMDLIAQGLIELARFAKGTNVKLLLSTHGDLVHADDIVLIMQMVNEKGVGIGWDILNMWSATHEPVPDTYLKLKNYIHFVHVKNQKTVNGKEQIVMMSEGDAPVLDGVDLLVNDGYKGYFSFVWEKHWFPELPEPEQAFEDYIKTMRAHFKNKANII
jgi:sugar phosphate isomerase/epimerase